ncbi:MAG: NAD(P)-dependent oxidoreductase, partial [Flavobacteriales bacterium]|nr:NAD(P)-dependent oxidoreductase [Flavobacteriales bacterium]
MKSQQKVLITGATSGLGLEFAQLAHDAGWQLLLTGRN